MLPPRLPRKKPSGFFFETGGTAAALQGGKRKRKRFFPLSSLFEGRTRPRICCLRLFSKIYFYFLFFKEKKYFGSVTKSPTFPFPFQAKSNKIFLRTCLVRVSFC